METINSNKIVLMVLAIFGLTLVADSFQGYGKSPIEEEETDLDTQLKIINKPALKSFKTEYGDIIDCIEINKQLAFDHPLLKNHTIQMKPEIALKNMGNEGSSTVYKSSNYMPKNIKCSQGTVAIKRTTKEDLIRAKSIKSLGLNLPINAYYHPNNIMGQGHNYAMLVKEGAFGARARMNTWKPVVKENQASSSNMWLANGDGDAKSCIQVGWIVQYNDANRLYTYWTGDGYERTGCFNTQCPGFVQVSPDIALGLVLPQSTYNGSQFDMLVSVYLDQVKGNWWLMYEDKYVGYWPKLIVPALGRGAHFVSWGGEVYSSIQQPSPAMGSGHLPFDASGANYGKTAYIAQMQVVTDFSSGTSFKDPNVLEVKIWADKTTCYNATMLVDDIRGLGLDLYYGGPGNCS